MTVSETQSQTTEQDKKEMTPDEHKQMLKDCGLEVAEIQLTKAIETAKNPEQADNQLAVLRFMAISILAHEFFNTQRKRTGFIFKDFMETLQMEIEYDLAELHKFEDAEKLKALGVNAEGEQVTANESG